MDASKLPPGVEPAPAGASERVAVARETGPNKVTFDNPTMTGHQFQVQHPADQGGDPTEEPGLFAGTVVQTRVGPLICIQTRHHDGTSLTTMMTFEEARQWDRTWADLCQRALALLQPQGRG